MNYFYQLNGFWRWKTTNELNRNAMALYFAILHIANSLHGKTSFSIPNMTLMSMTGLSRTDLHKQRLVLSQTALIGYEKGKKSTAGLYTVLPLYDTNLDAQPEQAISDAKTSPLLRTHMGTHSATKNMSPLLRTHLDTNVETHMDTNVETHMDTNVRNIPKEKEKEKVKDKNKERGGDPPGRSASPPPSRPKKQYADLVFLTQDQYDTLVTDLGEQATQECIEILSNYKASSGKTYESDYHAIRKWVITARKERQKADISSGISSYSSVDIASLEQLHMTLPNLRKA